MRMPRKKTLLYLLPFLVLNLAGWILVRHELISDRLRSVHIEALVPAGDADGSDRLALLLDRDLCGGKPEEAPPPEMLFSISPAPPGCWHWAAPDRVEYILDEPLPPGRVYVVRPANEFESITGWRWGGDDEIRFTTRALKLVTLHVGRFEDDRVSVQLVFNQIVDPADLKNRVVVRAGAGSSPLGVEIASREPASRLRILFPKPDTSRFTVTLAADLKGFRAERPLGSVVRRSLKTPKGFVVAGVRWYGFNDRRPDPDFATVALRFTANLDGEWTPRGIVVKPDLPGFTAEVHRGNHLKITGPFRCGTRYEFTVPANTPSDDGRTLGHAQTTVYKIPRRDPHLRIPFDRGVLSPDGNLVLEAEVVNVPRVRLRISRVHENNLVAHLHGLGREETSREILTRTFDLELPPHQLKTVALDLAGLLPERRGLYLLELSDPTYRWRRDRAIVSVSDLCLTVKTGRNGLTAFVTSLTTARGLEGVKLTVLSVNNQVTTKGVTDEHGLARLKLPEKHPDGAPFLVVARLLEDTGYLRLDRNPWVFNDLDVSGREPPRHYDLMLYPDRTVYRPGETIHLTGILRWADGRVPPPFPLTVNVTRPDGLRTAELTAHPGAQGIFHLDFGVPADGQTGPWLFAGTLPASEDVLGSTVTLVEAFLPARIEIKALTDKPLTLSGESPTLSIEARYLFDQPAAELPLSVRWRYVPQNFSSASHPDLVFSLEDQPEAVEGSLGALTLDAEGHTELEIPPAPGEIPARYRLTLTTTVTEPGSRSVSNTVIAAADTASRHLGLRAPETGFVPIDLEIPIEWVLLTPNDRAAAPGPLAWRVYRVDHDYEHLLVDGRRTWRSKERLVKVVEGELTPQEPQGEIPIRLRAWGRYRLLVTDVETKLTTRLDLYAASDYSGARTLALKSVERLELVPDRPTYSPGEIATVLVRSPFPGTLLLSLESTEVEFSEVIEMTAAETTVTVPIPDHLRGGAVLTAAVVRPVEPDSDDWRPHRAMGAVRIQTRHDSRRIALLLDAPERVEPGAEITVSLTVDPALPGGPAMLHLFAVDEGILLAGNTPTPDPHAHFFAPRRPTVTTADLFPDLLPDMNRPDDMLRIGGGAGKGGAQRALRRNPVPTKRRTPGVVFKEAVVADETGRATFTLDLPELTGALRLMAVAVCGDRYGSAEQRLVLSGPLGVEAGWPGFLAPGDRVRVPLKVFNRTEGDVEVDLELTLDGPIRRLPGDTLLGIGLPAQGHTTVLVNLEATGIGPATARLSAISDAGQQTASRIHFPVRPATPLIVRSKPARVAAGETLTLSPQIGFLPGAHRTLVVSAEPALDLRPAVEALIDYPYGCVEQTTSRLFAILHAPALIALAEDPGDREKTVADMIRRGMERFLLMQTRGGGLAYWPGGGRPDLFGSAYAASFLVAARTAGHQPPPALLPDLLGYLQRELNADRTISAERALIVRVLAAFDRPQMGWMARLAELGDELDVAAKAHLAAAYFEAGRRDRALKLLPASLGAAAIPTTTTGRLTSSVRQWGVLLDVLLTIDPEHELVPHLARELNRSRTEERWDSTLSNAAAVAALVRYRLLREQVEPAFTVHIRCGDLALTADHTRTRVFTLPIDGGDVVIDCIGQGAAHLLLRTEGLAEKADGADHDRGLTARKTWLDADGRPVDPRKLSVGDLVRVEVTLAAPAAEQGKTIGNIVMVDALPGGCEIENPRLATSAARGRAKLGEADRVEFLDDRVLLFTSVGREKLTFSWFLRVVSAGDFTIPPVQASCMYLPELSSISGEGAMEVRR